MTSLTRPRADALVTSGTKQIGPPVPPLNKRAGQTPPGARIPDPHKTAIASSDARFIFKNSRFARYSPLRSGSKSFLSDSALAQSRPVKVFGANNLLLRGTRPSVRRARPGSPPDRKAMPKIQFAIHDFGRMADFY
ncbi:hypothetical protein EVAR_84034_1 [Eumeta japonica]|uniref:Uncharacterized protein n=1 Tax=Eumeta variegata TaxID=151549 RepID=A0A4C1X903_EUMVA|nr:hypothetical protein EVAR_84034_1 [Eumeta japonica]